jgi:hypothetical protein
MDHHGGRAATVGPAVDEPGRRGPADPDRVDLTWAAGRAAAPDRVTRAARVFAAFRRRVAGKTS